jgi:hypothetical protein
MIMGRRMDEDVGLSSRYVSYDTWPTWDFLYSNTLPIQGNPTKQRHIPTTTGEAEIREIFLFSAL